MILQFGEFIAEKRKGQGISLRGMADELGITPAYLSDIEKSRRNPPDIDTLEKMARLLKITPEEKNTMLDYAGKDRKQIAPDLPDYIMSFPEIRAVIRKARDKGKRDDFWGKISEQLDDEI